jgi:diadenosine tetraphosphate (Ap4A) HIT family hydrolase
VFYKILQFEIPAKKIYENDVALAFYDINPICKIHALVITKGLYKNFSEFVTAAPAEEVKTFFTTIAKVAEILGIVESGYRLVSNLGSDSGQKVEHFHFHILGGERLK